MFSSKFVLALILTLSGMSASASANACCTLRSDGVSVLVKSIIENLGGTMLRGLVIDSDGRQRRIFFNSTDAVEVKRGMWVLKAGDYKSEI